MREHIISLQRQVAEATERLKGLVAKAEGENRDLTAEEKAAFTKDEGEIKALKARLERAETVEREAAATVVPVLEGTKVVPAKAKAPLTTHERAEDAPWPEGPRMAFAAFMKAVHLAEPRVADVVDPRLRKLAASTNEAVGSEGGFLLESQSVGLIDKLAFDSAQLAQRCFPIEVGEGFNSATVTLIAETSRVTGSRFGGIQLFHAAESATVTETRPKTRKVDVKLEKLLGLWYVSDEEIQDVAHLASIGPQAFAEELAFQVDEDIFAGTGAGQALGIINSPALVSISGETGQPATEIWEANLRKIRARMPSRSRARAIWLVHADVESELMATFINAGVGGQPVFLPPGGYSNAPYGTLFGIPVIVNEHSKALGLKGDIVLADFGWYAHVKKGGTQIAESIHVRFIYDEMAFRFTFRSNGLPLLGAPITAAQGGNDLSPFVTLAAR